MRSTSLARDYFNSGVMLMNLDELRKQHFFERAVEFLNSWSGYRFRDQSAINFLLHGTDPRIAGILESRFLAL